MDLSTEASGLQNHAVHATDILRSLDGITVATRAPQALVANLVSRLQEASASSHGPDHTSQVTLQELLPHFEIRGGGMHVDFERLIDSERLLALAFAITFLRDLARGNLEATPLVIEGIWHILHGVITSSENAAFSFSVSKSAQGFLAVPLCSLLKDGNIDELFRFHVWLPGGGRGLPEFALHSHQAFAQSWILTGKGQDLQYEALPCSDASEATHAVYIPQWNDGKQRDGAYKTHQISSTIVNTGMLRVVQPTTSHLHTIDMTYTIPAGVYHQTLVDPSTFHATMFFFDASRGFIPNAGVLGPVTAKDSTQIRDAGGVTPTQLAQMVGEARRREIALPNDLPQGQDL